VCLEASSKPHVHRKVENFGTNIASTMACPNFKNGPKTALRPLGVNCCPNEHAQRFKIVSILTQASMKT
jgi:hypothetical protein